MADGQTHVIVGAGLAGARAAETLRKEGFDGRVVLVGDESYRPYERPGLSKEYLRGEEDRDALWVHDEGFYETNRIELLMGAQVTSIDPAAPAVTLATGERIQYSKLLLATGSRARQLEVPGSDLDGIHYLRTLEDADRLRDALRKRPRVVSIGGGWIGSEVAASARQMGCDVTVVTPGKVLLDRVVGADVGRIFGDVHAENGVVLRTGTAVAAIRGTGTVEQVVTKDGTAIPCDLVVLGIGAVPLIGLGTAVGMRVEGGGVVTDEFLETEIPGIFAAGDVATAWNTLFGMRIRTEHWGNARFSGQAAARNMLGQHKEYDRTPYFYSDQFDLTMEYWGHAPEWDRVLIRGDAAARRFAAFWIHDGIVVAAMNAGHLEDRKLMESIVTARRPVDPARLQDADVALDTLMAGATA